MVLYELLHLAVEHFWMLFEDLCYACSHGTIEKYLHLRYSFIQQQFVEIIKNFLRPLECEAGDNDFSTFFGRCIYGTSNSVLDVFGGFMHPVAIC